MKSESNIKLLLSTASVVVLAAILAVVYSHTIAQLIFVYALPVGMALIVVLMLEAFHYAVYLRIEHRRAWWYLFFPLGFLPILSWLRILDGEQIYLIYYLVFYAATFCYAWQSKKFELPKS